MSNLTDILKQYWGFDTFRFPQQEIIEHILQGKDTVALLPTGGGKSICFQLPAMALDGICIVISPLIALMKDQVDNLQKIGIAAVSINSSMNFRQIDIVLTNAMEGRYKLIYISPERIASEIFVTRLKNMNISLIAIDEAHCISQWGYDFRPAYLKIPSLREMLPDVPCIALTATATEDVLVDIQQKLAFKSQHIFKKSFARKNLSYVVAETEDKLKKMVEILQKVSGTGIIYVRNRKRTKEIAELLFKSEINADYYHAGLSNEDRERKQCNWISGKTRVIVCTNAFGMGIDKPDVRVVIHLDIPPDIESYYQEAGRAGRDGLKSYAVAIYHQVDKQNAIHNLRDNQVSIEEIKQCYDSLGQFFHLAIGSGAGEIFDFQIEDFCLKYSIKATKALNALKILEQEEIIWTSEAIYLQSKVMISCKKEELYKLQVSHPQYDPLIKLMLRSYAGLFDNFTTIKESFLANKLKTTVDNIRKALVLLQEHKYIEYLPESNAPKIQFLQSRHSKTNLLLNTELISKRAKIKERKLSDMIYYLDNMQSCRSKVLCHYFDDNESVDCQVCDICIKRKKLGLDAEKYNVISKQIVEQISLKSEHMHRLVALLPSFSEAEIISCVQWLLETKVLEQNEFGRLDLLKKI